MPNSVESFIASLGISTVMTLLFGVITTPMEILIIVMLIDVVTGIMAARAQGKKIKSSIAAAGVAKKVVMFFIIALGYQIDRLMGLDYVRNLVTYFYLANESFSILENADDYGVGFPAELMDIIHTIRNTKDKKEE